MQLLMIFHLSVSGQSATINDPFQDEADVRSNSNQIVVTLTGDTLLAEVATSQASLDVFLGGFSDPGSNITTLIQGLTISDIALSSGNTVATLTVPATSDYFIAADESVTFSVPSASLEESVSDLSAGTISIANLNSTITGDAGDLDTGAPESSFRTADQTYTLTLENNLWHADITTSADLLDSVKGMFSGGTYFPDLVAQLQSPDLTVSSDRSTLTITFGQSTDFYIPSNEVITAAVSTGMLEYNEALVNSQENFTISNEDPVISITSESYNETSIRNGSISFDITLSGDIWVTNPSLSNFRNNVVSGGVWDTDIAPGLEITRVDDHTITIVVPQVATFDIVNSETVEVSALNGDLEFTSSGSFTATQTKTITPASVSITGVATFDGVDEGNIRSSSYTITLTLYEDEWESAIGGNNNTNKALINSLRFQPSESTAASAMQSAILNGNNDGADNTSVSGNIVTINVPAVSAFDITQDVEVGFLVPHEALVNSGSDISTGYFASISKLAPTMEINSSPDPLYESALNSARIGVRIHEDQFNIALVETNFNLVVLPSNPGITVSSVDRISPDSCDLYLFYTGQMSENHTIDLTILGSELEGGEVISGANASITVIALIEPEITKVSIDDVAMGIGDFVTATITVEEPFVTTDFDSIKGFVAGRPLINSSLSKVSETLYTAEFEITEGSNPQFAPGDPIPVSGVQLFNDTVPGNIFDGTIMQGNDLLDSERPIVSLLSFNNGAYNIGESVVATLQTPETGLLFDESLTTINAVQLSDPELTAYEAGSGVYQLIYTVKEGDADVVAPAEIPVNIVFVDAAGNASNPKTSFSGTSPVIDANSPHIISVDEASSGIMIPTNSVIYDISSDESGLVLGSNTLVNTVGTISGRLALVPQGSKNYRLIYEVGQDDPEVVEGALTATIALKDPAGNETIYVGSISNRDVSIVTSTPDARMLGGGEICAGDSATLNISIEQGVPPYDIVLYENGVIHGEYTDVRNSLSVKVSPAISSEYQVYSVTDSLGNIAYFNEKVQVMVNPLPDVSFSTSVRKTFSVEGGGSYLLPATPAGGLFSGSGVVQAESRFYPEIAGVQDSIPITYMYEDNTTGCLGHDTVYFDVLPTSGGLTISYPDVTREGIICYDDAQFLVEGNNVDGLIGTFHLYRLDKEGDIEVSEAIVDAFPNDNRAIIDPSVLIAANRRYRVEYHYTWKGEVVIAEEEMEFDYITEIVFDEDMPSTVCRDEAAFDLEALPDNGSKFEFTGTGVIGNELLGYSFEPDSGLIGTNFITYIFTSDAGCTREGNTQIITYDVPDVHFTPRDVCIPPIDQLTGEGGGPITIMNETNKSGLVETWYWEFGDINSGAANYDTIIGDGMARDVIHEYTAPGNRNVSLYVETIDGCDAAFDTIIEFADKPEALFRAVSDCWIRGEPIEFKNNSKSNKSWDSFTWNISDAGGTWDTTFVTMVVDSIARVYFNDDKEVYSVQMIAQNVAGTQLFCYDTLTENDFELKPTQGFEGGSTGILMDFEASNQKWTPDSSTNHSSWEWGTPYFNGYHPPVDNQSAWYTKKKDKAARENSWIQSQCFDLRNLERPMIRMDVMRSFDLTRDGAVLQYSLDNGNSWNTVGNIGEGIHWYNAFDISNRPGGGKAGTGSPFGWSGSVNQKADSNWVMVAHDLDAIRNERLVIFGIYYATDGASITDNQGFAVDNIFIGERTKRGLVEHFTSTVDEESGMADTVIYDFIDANPLDVTSLQYHLNYNGFDPVFARNPAPASARSFYYGITELPFALLDGGPTAEYRYDFGSEPTSAQLKSLTLESPLFELDLTFQSYSDHLGGNVTMKAVESINSMNVMLNLAVVKQTEQVLVDRNGFEMQLTYRNLVLDLIPTAAGKVYSESWSPGVQKSEHFSWEYENIEENEIPGLRMVAFLQNRETGKVLQVAEAESTHPNRIDHREVGKMKIYPNPVRYNLYLEPVSEITRGMVVEITDMTGRVLEHVKLQERTPIVEISTAGLSPGTYQIFMKQNGRVTGRSTFIKVR